MAISSSKQNYKQFSTFSKRDYLRNIMLSNFNHSDNLQINTILGKESKPYDLTNSSKKKIIKGNTIDYTKKNNPININTNTNQISSSKDFLTNTNTNIATTSLEQYEYFIDAQEKDSTSITYFPIEQQQQLSSFQQTARVPISTGNKGFTNNVYLNGILWGGNYWNSINTSSSSTVIDYSFWNSGTESFDDSVSIAYDWTSSEKISMINALNTWASVANIEFVNAGDNQESATLGFYIVDNNTLNGAFGEFEPPGEDKEGIGLFNYQGFGWNVDTVMQEGSYGFVTMIHELGHGLGLAHPHDFGGGSPRYPGVTSPNSLGNFQLNQGIYTTMTYNDGLASDNLINFGFTNYGYQGTPMAFDIAAIQYLYGANNTHNSGNDIYYLPSDNQTGTMYSSIWDTKGTDKISADGASNGVTINLNDATLDTANGSGAGGYLSSVDFIYGGFTIANGVSIENADGGIYNDLIIGNEYDNVLQGFAGNDTIEGNAGDDTIRGGNNFGDYAVYSGNSSEYGVIKNSNGVYTIIDLLSDRDGKDTLIDVESLQFSNRSMVIDSFIAPNNDDFIDRFVLTGYNLNTTGTNIGFGSETGEPGQSGQINSAWWSWTAPESSFVTIGTRGSDFNTFLSVFTGNSVNSLNLVDSNNDIDFGVLLTSEVSFNAVAGTTYRIAVDGRSGSTGNISLNIHQIQNGNITNTINGTNNSETLNGTTGNDRIIGNGGNDTLDGRSGNDVLDGSTGNDLINGGRGNDILNGRNGTDELIGGRGDDYYFVDNTGDILTEQSNQGDDTVSSSIAYQLNNNFEDLILTGTIQRGNGNNLENLIIGNSGDNRLNGKSGNDTLIGGAGNDDLISGTGLDSLVGGFGDDVYLIGNEVFDVITENFNEGFDTVRTSQSYTLPTHIDALVLISNAPVNGQGNSIDNLLQGNPNDNILRGFDGHDSLVGTGGDDELYGSNGNDSLNGGFDDDTLVGGIGDDILRGGVGNDAYLFNNTNEGVDTFEDFSVSNDVILIRSSGFSGLSGMGTLSANQFRVGASATTANHRFIYNSGNGNLFYDFNGNAPGGSTLFASLEDNLSMTNQNIVLI